MSNNESINVLDLVIDNIMNERLFNKLYILKPGSEYQQRMHEMIELGKKFKCKEFIKYEELEGMNKDDLARDAYKQGFVDGIELLKSILLQNNDKRLNQNTLT